MNLDLVNPRQRTIIAIKNQNWKPLEGDATEEQHAIQLKGKWLNFPIPPDVEIAELRPPSTWASIYFDKRETRTNPGSVLINREEERTSHTEIFFNDAMEEMATRVLFTDWQPVKVDLSVVAEKRGRIRTS